MKLSKSVLVSAYVTRDGSQIRELMHPDVQGSCNQSLAEATVPVGCETHLHRHVITEEIYHILSGNGRVRVGGDESPVEAGDTVLIPAGTPHNIRNTGNNDLVFLCSCSPAYSHEDTELL